MKSCVHRALYLVWRWIVRNSSHPPTHLFIAWIAQARIVWISAGDERVGFETSKTEDADLMYQAICILVDRCHA